MHEREHYLGPACIGFIDGEGEESWTADGRSLWVFHRGEVPAPVWRVDIATGQRQPVKKLVPPDPASVYSIINFKTTPSGHAYFYTYTRLLSQLYVARNLR